MSYPDVHRIAGGEGIPLVLIHGTDGPTTTTFRRLSPLACGRDLVLPTRFGWPTPDGTCNGGAADFARDGDDLLALLAGTGGAHVLGYSYGCLGALAAASQDSRPIHSLVLLEPPAFSLAIDVPAVASIVSAQAELAGTTLADEEYLAAYRSALGAAPRSSPGRLTATGRAIVTAMRTQRAAVEFVPAREALAQLTCPVTIVTGGWSAAFEVVADRLAALLNSVERIRLEAKRHELPSLGGPMVELVERHLVRAESSRSLGRPPA